MARTSNPSPVSVRELGVGTNLQFVRTLQSSVTTSWGVEWDENLIARDLLQNFFDANRQSLDRVRTTVEGNDVQVTAPTPFDLNRLFYLGSEKGPDDVGQYGEGFKAAATCLLRDHGVTPIAASGHDVVVLRISDDAVPNTQMFPVLYDFYRSASPVPGSLLRLNRCPKKLLKAMQSGMLHFFHEGNPLLKGLLWTNHGHFRIYSSSDGVGHIFYRNLKRGEFDGIPVVLVIDKEYAEIEKKIRNDRDRNAFGDAILKLFYRTFATSGLRESFKGQKVVVEAAKPIWVRGHPLLAALAEAMYERLAWKGEQSDPVFQRRYYTPSTTEDRAEILEFERTTRAWDKEGRQCLPQYFAKFGVINPRRHLQDILDTAVRESIRDGRRSLTPAENAASDLLKRVMRELSPGITGLFEKWATSYTVAETEIVLGQLKKGRGYRSVEVYLAASVFELDFAAALAVFLHEHAHVFGQDGSRGFTDALTELLEISIRMRSAFDRHESEWKRLQSGVLKERKRVTRSKKSDTRAAVAGLSEKELRQLVLKLPESLLAKHMKE